MKHKNQLFLDDKLATLDEKFSDLPPVKPELVATPQSLETLLAHTAFQMSEVSGGLRSYLSANMIDPQAAKLAYHIELMYRVQNNLEVVASNKILVQPKIQGLDINVYYKYNSGRNIYEYASAKIANTRAISDLSSSELDITDKIQYLMDTFANMPEIRVVPHYINNALFNLNGCQLDIDENNPPSAICVAVTLTVKAMDIIERDLDMDTVIRGWLNSPKTMLRDRYPKIRFVATDIRANNGYLDSGFSLPKDISKCITYFHLNKRSLLQCLRESGFETSILFTSGNDTCLVRGTIMGASHLCIENYIAPALESIKATKSRVRGLKTAKARERFLKSTRDKSEDNINILNYLRTFDYFVIGLWVEPNFSIIRRRVSNVVGGGYDRIYVEPSIVGKLNDSSVLEVIAVMGLSVSDAVDVVEYTGYDGMRNVFTKKTIRELKRDTGIEITEEKSNKFRESFERIKERREINGTPNLIMLREKLWTL